MKTKQESAKEILDLLSPGYNIVGSDEFGMELVSKDDSHIVKLTGSTVSFEHKTNKDIKYSMGANSKNVREFLKHPKSFKEEDYKPAEPETKKEKKEKAPKVKVANPTKAATVEVSSGGEPSKRIVVNRKSREGRESCRQIVYKGIAEKKTKEELAPVLKAAYPDRDDKNIKWLLNLYFAHHAKGK